MKFQLKALVAALALSAATLPAQAAMQTPTASGNSSMILTLLDFSNNVSATFDLGYTYSEFNSLVTAANSNGGAFSWDITGGDYAAAWASFSDIANLSTTKWAIFAGDNTGTGAGDRGMITTYKSGANQTNSNALQNAIVGAHNYMNSNNSQGNHGSVDDGASFVNSNTAASYAGRAGAYGSTGRLNASGHVSMDLLGSSMTLVQQEIGATAASRPSFDILAGANGSYTFSMDNAGKLTFLSPVPEADSYAMLLAGLGVVGLVARRRKA